MTDQPEQPKDKDDLNLHFRSPAEFAEVCRTMSLRMHYLNRVAMGETRFAWEVADMLSRLGAAFRDFHDDKDINRRFGDGWTKGEVTKAEAPQALHDLIYRNRSS